MDFARIAFSQAWQVTALIVVVLIATRLLAKNRPHLAYALWLVVLVKCVTPPFVSSPSGAFSWIERAVAYEATATWEVEPVSDESRIGIDFDFAEIPDAAPGDVELHMQAYEFPIDAVDIERPADSTDEGTSSLLFVCICIWAVGAALALLVNGLRWLNCLWKLRRTESIDAPELQTLLVKLARELKVRRRVRLLVTTSRIGPAVIGLLRPLIVLPEVVVSRKRPEDLEAILAHELIHVRRGDLWLGMLQVCAKAAWWFYPLVWWVSRLSTREAERCCDEEVIGELGCDPKRYARSLLEVLELKKTLQPIPAFPGMKPVEVTSQRLERIMKLGQGCHKRSPRWCWAIMLLFAAAALPGAAFIAADENAKDYPTPQRLEFIRTEQADGQTVGYWVDEGGQEFSFQVAPTVSVPDGGTILFGSGIKKLATVVDSQDASTRPDLSVVAYSADEILPAIREEYNCDERTALRAFGGMLISGSSPHPRLPAILDRMRVWNGSIAVAASADEHQRMSTAIERWKAHGVSQIAIETRFANVTERFLKQQITNWELTPLDLGSQDRSNPQALGVDPINWPLPNDEAKPLAKAGVTTTTNLPALYKILDAKQAERLLDRLQRDGRSNLLAAPKTTVFNGQTAKILDVTQRPFVVGVTTVGDEVKAAQPQIQVIDSGRIARLRPLLRGKNRVWLDYDLKASHIEDVSKTEVHPAGLKEPITLQVPKVHSARIESAVELELGQTVIIRGLTDEPARRKPQQLLVLMTVTRVKPQGIPSVDIEEAKGELLFDEGVASDLGVTGDIVVDDRTKSKHREHETVPILGAVTSGGPTKAIDPPTDDEVFRALDKVVEGGPSFLHEKKRKRVRIVKEKIADYVDRPRFIPTLGPAQLHHAHYKCTVYYDEHTKIGWPIPHELNEHISQVVYIDHTHFHMVDDAALPSNDADERDYLSIGRNKSELNRKLEQTGTIILRDASLADWLIAIQKQWKVDIVGGSDLSQDIATGAFTDAKLREVLTSLLRVRGYGYRKVGNSLVVMRLDHMTIKPGQRRVLIPLKHVAAADVEAPVKLFLSQTGHAQTIPSSNSLFVIDSSEVISRIRKFAAELEGHLEKRNDASYAAVYNVVDLLAADLARVAPDDFELPKQPKPNYSHRFDLLETLITESVVPGSWQPTGGNGKIEAFATNHSLVISQTMAGHREVVKFLRQLRERLGLASSNKPVPVPQPPRRRSTQFYNRVYNRVYNVAELVIPVANSAAAKEPPAVAKDLNDASVADFDTLIDLITSTVSPDTWDEVGGAGAIEPFPTTLSLVVSQTQEVHEQIAELLAQLRKLQDVQVTIEAKFIRMPKDLPVHEFRTDGHTTERGETPLVELIDGSATLTAPEKAFLLDAVASFDQVSMRAGPKVTLFNGQHATISMSSATAKQETKFHYQGVCSDDRRSVRLSFGGRAAADDNKRKTATIKAGDSWLIDIGDQVDAEAIGFPALAKMGVPLLGKFPYVGRRFKNTGSKEPMQVLVLLTPQIIVQEEEEQLLGIEITP